MVLFIWGPFSTVISKTASFPNQLPTELIGKNCHSVNKYLNFYWYTLDATSSLLLSRSAVFVSILHCSTWISIPKTVITITFISLVAQMVKHLPTTRGTWVWFLGRKISWSRKWQPTPVLSPEKSHGQRSLVGYSPWDSKELDTTERLHYNITYAKLFFKNTCGSKFDDILVKRLQHSSENCCLGK